MSGTHVMWEGLDASSLARLLDVPAVDLHVEISSTMDIAHRLAEQGAVGGTLVLADAQQSGRGRMGRSWASRPGQGIWCTFIQRPTDLDALDVLSLRIGLLIAENLDAMAEERVMVKWPNDLVVGIGKLGGILSEARWSGGQPAWVAIGVGVNVAAPGVAGGAGLPPGVRRVEVLEAIARAVHAAGDMRGWLSDAELARFRGRDVLEGRRLLTPAAGVAAGIAASGALIVETGQGSEQHRTGTVQYAEDM